MSATLLASTIQRRMMLATIIAAAGQSLAGTAGVLLAQQIAGTAWSGLPQALVAGGTAAATLVIGRVSLRRGRIRGLTIGQALAALGGVSAVTAAAMGAIIPLLIGVLALGAGQAATMLARYAAAEHSAPAARTRAMGRLLMATTIGAVAGPNLLAPSNLAGSYVGLPPLMAPFVVATFAFVLATALLATTPAARIPVDGAIVPAPRIAVDAAPATLAPWARQNVAGAGILAVSNLVMISVMTLTPVHLEEHGIGLLAIGLIVSLHIAGMFAPSAASGWIVDRLGPSFGCCAGGGVMTVACIWAALTAHGFHMAVSMVLLGVGWNLCLIAGSALITHGVPSAARPTREAWGDAGMGVAAMAGGASAGPIMAAAGYTTLAVFGAGCAALIAVAGLHRSARCTDPGP